MKKIDVIKSLFFMKPRTPITLQEHMELMDKYEDVIVYLNQFIANKFNGTVELSLSYEENYHRTNFLHKQSRTLLHSIDNGNFSKLLDITKKYVQKQKQHDCITAFIGKDMNEHKRYQVFIKLPMQNKFLIDLNEKKNAEKLVIELNNAHTEDLKKLEQIAFNAFLND